MAAQAALSRRRRVCRQPDIAVPPTAVTRSDLRQPVLFFNTETDITVLGAGFSVHNEPDSNTFRMWEVAGTTSEISAGRYIWSSCIQYEGRPTRVAP